MKLLGFLVFFLTLRVPGGEDKNELGDLLLHSFLLYFLILFFLCLGGERDSAEEDVRRLFLNHESYPLHFFDRFVRIAHS